MDNWSGALVCPDERGTFYAVGLFHAHAANCDQVGAESSPEKFETLVSTRAREGIIDIIRSTPPKVYRCDKFILIQSDTAVLGHGFG